MPSWIELSSNTTTTTPSSAHLLPRSSCSTVHINNQLYMYGGEHKPRTPIDSSVHTFDLTTSQWFTPATQSAASACPPDRVGHAAAAIHNTIYIYGGRVGVEQQSKTLDDLWSYHTTTSTWTQLPQHTTDASHSRPPPLSYHAMTADAQPGLLYMWAGCSPGPRMNVLYQYDTNTHTWTQLSQADSVNAPTPRGGSTVVLVGDRLLCMFGYNGKTECDDQYMFDLKTRHWSAYTTTNTCGARSVTDAVYLSDVGAQGSVFVALGECSPSARGHESAGKFLQDVWLLDIATKTWHDIKTDNMPAARGWFSTVAVSGSSAAVFGGLGNDDLRRSDVWLFNAK